MPGGVAPKCYDDDFYARPDSVIARDFCQLSESDMAAALLCGQLTAAAGNAIISEGECFALYRGEELLEDLMRQYPELRDEFHSGVALGCH